MIRKHNRLYIFEVFSYLTLLAFLPRSLDKCRLLLFANLLKFNAFILHHDKLH